MNGKVRLLCSLVCMAVFVGAAEAQRSPVSRPHRTDGAAPEGLGQGPSTGPALQGDAAVFPLEFRSINGQGNNLLNAETRPI